jgi:hypothetical protein
VLEPTVQSPALGRGETSVEIGGSPPVFHGLSKEAGHFPASIGNGGPIFQVEIQVVPGEDALTPEGDFGLGADVGEMEERVFDHGNR